jgi:hypothetical protein
MDLSRTGVSDYDVTWGAYVFGAVDKVDPSGMKIKTKPIKVGTLGDIMIGERIIGLEGTLKIEIREVDQVTLKALVPWAATAGQATPGSAAVSIPIIPATFHKDRYDYALPLKLHPTHLASSDTSQDMVLLKAVGNFVYLGDRDGVKDNALAAEFMFFPNRSDLTASPPLVNYGYYGVAP